jgi:hypothetical protein
MGGASGITPRVPSGACWSHKMTHKLRVDVLSDQDYKELIAECYVDDDCVMIVSEERGPDQLEIEILVRPDGQPRRIEYDVLVELLQEAKARLWELRRVPGSGTEQVL